MLIHELTVDAAANQNHEFHGQTTIPVITFWNFTVSLYWSTFATNLISSLKKLVYELPYKLPNDLTLRILENLGNIRKILN